MTKGKRRLEGKENRKGVKREERNTRRESSKEEKREKKRHIKKRHPKRQKKRRGRRVINLSFPLRVGAFRCSHSKFVVCCLLFLLFL